MDNLCGWLWKSFGFWIQIMEEVRMTDIIQSLWIGSKLPTMQQMSIKSFLNNGHTYHLYVYGTVKNIPIGTIIKDAKQILPESRIFVDGSNTYAAFADLFRYKLLLEKGGWWVDIDTICLRPFDFKTEYVFSSENHQEYRVSINNDIIKVPCGCKFIRTCYKKVNDLNARILSWEARGPALMRTMIPKFSLNSFVQPPHVFCPINYWEIEKLIDPNYSFTMSKETYALHLWYSMWRRKGLNPNILYPENSLYGQLQRQFK